MHPDVQGESSGGRVYGDAKLAADFREAATEGQLRKYVNGLPTDNKLVMGVRSAVEAEAYRALEAWHLAGGVQLVAF